MHDRKEHKGLKEPKMKKENEKMANPIAVPMFYPRDSKFTHGLSSAETRTLPEQKKGCQQA